MVMSSKWMRLIGLVGFTAVLVSCKQTPQAPMNANYATMKVTVSDKEILYLLFSHDPWTAGYRYLSTGIRNYRAPLRNRR